MALTKITGQVINTTTDVTVGILTVTDTLAVGGTVSVGGTLTYEDVTNIDSVGLVTARNGIVVGSGITLSKDGDIFATGVTTSTTFVGNLTGNVTGNISGGTVAGSTGTFGDTSDSFTTVTILSSTSGISELRLGDTTANAGFVKYEHSNNALIFATDANERLRISSTGSVGIGTITPAGMLEVQKNGVPAIIANYNNSKHLQMGAGASGAGFHLTTGNFFTINHQPYTDRGTDSNLTERLRITSGGEVGIGTETIYTGAKLDVVDGFVNVGAADTTKDSRIQFTRKDTGIFGWIGIPTWNPNAFFFYVPKDSSPYNETGAVYESETWSIYSAGTHRLTINPSGHVLPAVNDQYDLGSSSYRWRDIYTGDLNLSNKGKSNDVDGSWGDYTIQEGESDLFLINNRSGKKFKFNLTEVS